jgi:hypothetical protein
MPLHFVQIEHIVRCIINICLKHNANLKWKLNVMNLLTMNNLWFMVIHKSSDLLFTLLFGWKSHLILVIPNIFKALCIRDLASSNYIDKILIPLQFGHCMGRMDPTPHVRMPNRVSNLEGMTLNNVGINVGFICSASFHKRSHLHVAWVFVQAVAFYLLCQSLRKRLLKTCAFTNAWFWQRKVSHQVDGCLSFLSSMERSCSWCKCFVE